LKNVKIDPDNLKEYVKHVGIDLFTEDVLATLNQFEEADNFGSLIIPATNSAGEVLKALSEKYTDNLMALSKTHEEVSIALKQADYLSQKYHVVVANPPYMGGSNMNSKLSSYLKDNYPDVKSDLFSAFIVRNTELAVKQGQLGFMSPYVWMFISSYEKLRALLINQKTITSLIQLEYSGFDGATVPICTFTFENRHKSNYKGAYIRLSDFRGAVNQAPKTLEAINNHDCGWFYRVSADEFQKIPGSPIAYWVKIGSNFSESNIGKYFISGGRNKTHNDMKYVRFFWEVSHNQEKWVSYANGGAFRKFAGNEMDIVNWTKSAKEEYASHGGLCNPKFWDKEGITWSLITSAICSFRIKPKYSQYSSGSPTIFNKKSVFAHGS